MYRRSPNDPSGTGEFVEIGRYPNVIDAQLAHANLASQGIASRVHDAMNFYPGLSGAIGSRLLVREGDLHRARHALGARIGHSSRDDEEGDDVVRCPRCELAYCFYERANVKGGVSGSVIAILGAAFATLSEKRWRCHRCGHAWDDEREGPRRMTTLGPNDPRPIFRLRRDHAGLGAALGFLAGLFAGAIAAQALGPLALLLCVAGAFAGRLLGRSRYDVCSDPDCRAPLPLDREDCARCEGEIAGVVRSADEHWAAAADFRRELAAHHAKALARREKRRKRAAAE